MFQRVLDVVVLAAVPAAADDVTEGGDHVPLNRVITLTYIQGGSPSNAVHRSRN